MQKHIQDLFDDFKQRRLFLLNDERTVTTMTQKIWENVDASSTILLEFHLYITPFAKTGVLALFMSNEGIAKATVVSLNKEMINLLHTTKEQQLECLDRYWKVSTSQLMVEKVIQHMLSTSNPSLHTLLLSTCLEYTHLLPDTGKYFAIPVFFHMNDETCLLCWFVQEPDTEDTEKYITTHLIEMCQIESQVTEGQQMDATIKTLVKNIIRVNKKML